MTANDSVYSRFPFALELCDTRTRLAEFTTEPLTFELSFRMLARCPIAFARKTFSLLRQTFQRRFELPGDLSKPLGYRCLRK
jgi:hypothetical protein